MHQATQQPNGHPLVRLGFRPSRGRTEGYRAKRKACGCAWRRPFFWRGGLQLNTASTLHRRSRRSPPACLALQRLQSTMRLCRLRSKPRHRFPLLTCMFPLLTRVSAYAVHARASGCAGVLRRPYVPPPSCGYPPERQRRRALRCRVGSACQSPRSTPDRRT